MDSVFNKFEGAKKDRAGFLARVGDYLAGDVRRKNRKGVPLSCTGNGEIDSLRLAGVQHRISTGTDKGGRDDGVFSVRSAGIWLLR